jgi:hypothetical protein
MKGRSGRHFLKLYRGLNRASMINWYVKRLRFAALQTSTMRASHFKQFLDV